MTRIPPRKFTRPGLAPWPVNAVALVIALAVPSGLIGPAGAVTASSRTIQGAATGTQTRAWFTSSFDTGERFFGKLRGRIRLVPDTTATLSNTRTITSTDRGDVDGGQQVLTELRNDSVAARLQVTARPAIQLIFEWQPRGDPYVCDNTTFPVFSGDDWFMRTDGGGSISAGVCGAIDVSSDDLDRILRTTGIDLGLPEAFLVLDQFFVAAFSGTQSLSGDPLHLLEIKVCKIVTDTFGVPIGDHCDLDLNAVVTAPLTTLGHTLEAQLCTDGLLNGSSVPCLQDAGPKRTLTFTSALQSFSTQAPCAATATDLDVRVTNPAWAARLDTVTIAPALDFNVHLTANGDGRDLMTVPLPGSLPLLNDPMPLGVNYSQGSGFALHVADVTPDDDPPSVALSPSAVTIDEGSSTTFTPLVADLCTATPNLSSVWTIDGSTTVSPTLTLTYNNDLPTAVHRGSLVVTDANGNAAPAQAIEVTVRNVPPSLALTGLPSTAVPVGSEVRLTAQVTDPGADLMTWQWDFGDGTNAGRTAASVSDRTDSRTHVYSASGEYALQVGVNDGTDGRSVAGKVFVFDPLARIVGAGAFTADSSSSHVPVGSSSSIQANVSYAQEAVRPTGSFITDFLVDIGANQAAPAHLVATSYEWLLSTADGSKVQGLATLNGQAGWTFQAELTRSSPRPDTSRLTVTLYRPGVTTLANPDYRFSGLRKTGNIL